MVHKTRNGTRTLKAGQTHFHTINTLALLEIKFTLGLLEQSVLFSLCGFQVVYMACGGISTGACIDGSPSTSGLEVSTEVTETVPRKRSLVWMYFQMSGPKEAICDLKASCSF